MKADPAVQRALLDVQAADLIIDRVAHQTAKLPESQRVAEVEATVAELNGQRIEAETAVSDLGIDVRKAEHEVEAVRTRRTRNEQRMASGQVTNPKELENLQRENEALDRRIATLEDEELEFMEALEEANSALVEVNSSIDTVTAELEQAVAARDAALAELTAEQQQAATERESLLAGIPSELIEFYQRLREQYGGVGAALLRARACQGCRLELNAADLREIAAQSDDEVLRCPECRRILVRTAESGL